MGLDPLLEEALNAEDRYGKLAAQEFIDELAHSPHFPRADRGVAVLTGPEAWNTLEALYGVAKKRAQRVAGKLSPAEWLYILRRIPRRFEFNEILTTSPRRVSSETCAIEQHREKSVKEDSGRPQKGLLNQLGKFASREAP